MEISEEKELKYKRLAVDTVISYAREQGVKLRHSDFPLDSMWGKVIFGLVIV